MIARIVFPVILGIFLSDFYLYRQHIRRHTAGKSVLFLSWWLPGTLMMAYTIALALSHHFIPNNVTWLYTYLLLLGILVVPKILFALCSLVGYALKRCTKGCRNYGIYIGWILVAATIYIVLYGSLIGFEKIEVRHVNLYYKQLPPSFEGYRIVHFSDAHVGTYTGSRQHILEKAIDSIRAQHADIIAFTGDLQNIQPAELAPHLQLLSSLRAPDGVYSVLGNHDYSGYMDAPPSVKAYNERKLIQMERSCGWNLLLNEHRCIHRGRDSIFIAGEENDGTGRFPAKGDMDKTMRGIPQGAFTVLLQHDPSAWERHILPHTAVPLTLSGHTHGGQFKLFGWSPVMLQYKESEGLYRIGNSRIYVTAGLGGVIPFRFGMPGEIVVITLHRQK